MRDLVALDADGHLVALALTDPPVGASPRVLAGFEARHTVAVTGVCPACGAVRSTPSRAERRHAQRTGRPVRVTVEHEPTCPAIEAQVVAAAEGGPS